MRGERSHIQPKTLPGVSGPTHENPGRIRPDASTSTMCSHRSGMLSQSTRSLDTAFTGTDVRSSQHVTDKSLNAPDWSPSWYRSQSSSLQDDADQGSKLERYAVAHRRSIDGSITIPRCILKKKPNIRQLVELSRSTHGRTNSKRAAEVQALKKPIAPVNKDTMKELELLAIQNNLSLRIDLCFDDQLFFQPIKGRKGEEKQCRARVFWDCLSLELQAYRHAFRDDCSECAALGDDAEASGVELPSRLAGFFGALRDLIEMLVPDNDKEDILCNLDVDHLVRITRCGQFDAVGYSAWLAKLLMTHCAPLRDEMAREMHKKISDGAKSNDMDLLVDGLEILLALLENMKLDVANHQVRSFKLLLIADTVPFLKDCFATMQETQQIDLTGSLEWFTELQRQQERHHQQRSDFERFVCGSVMLCKSPCKAVPTTFSYDKERLLFLRNEVLDLTQLRICMSTFDEFTFKMRGRYPEAVESAKVHDRLVKLICSDDGNSEGVAYHLEEIATELARASAGVDTGILSSSKSTVLAASDLDLQQATEHLESRLEDEQFDVMRTVLDELTERTIHHANEFSKLDTLQVSNSQRMWTTSRLVQNFAPVADIEDIARRLAHIVVIHWAVWSELLYLADEQSTPS